MKINFSEGKDRDRDAKFTGMANKFPSKSKPWEGKFVIQAKHTTKPYASCSDSDFKRILRDEVMFKLIPLKNNKKVDYYLLFTNRRLSGLQDAKIENFIDEKVGVENRILGDERNYAGWSFVKLDDFGKLQYGSKLMNATYDPTYTGQFASFGFDDGGLKADKEYLIKEG